MPRTHLMAAAALVASTALAAPAFAEQAAPRAEEPPPAGAPNSRSRPAPGAPMRPPVNRVVTPWQQTAEAHRGHNGRRVAVYCPGGGTTGSVWGDGLYTDDSSICTAAVHAGRITTRGGGTVVIRMEPGARSYPSATSNGVRSAAWGSWSGSFVVVGGSRAVPPVRLGPSVLQWSDTATGHRGRHGVRLGFTCPAGGQAGTVWGSGIYTDDSSICTAAVHDGRISLARGGKVTIEVRPGEPKYAARLHNGVLTQRWGKWSGSFVFVP